MASKIKKALTGLSANTSKKGLRWVGRARMRLREEKHHLRLSSESQYLDFSNKDDPLEILKRSSFSLVMGVIQFFDLSQVVTRLVPFLLYSLFHYFFRSPRKRAFDLSY
jgi:hypothetical protein